MKSVKGTHDLYGKGLRKFQIIESALLKIANKYNYQEIRTPIFEYSGIFIRNIGDLTDIVTKEMYLLQDRSGKELALRPEGTAAVVRALITNNLVHILPQRLFYYGPMFRYERPQQGRYRQFYQLGFECFEQAHPLIDAEMIKMAIDLLKLLGIEHYEVLINSLGSKETLENYKKILVTYFNDCKDRLSPTSLVRLEKNPLRILDSKDPQDQLIIDKAPKLSDHLISYDSDLFAQVLDYLKQFKINYQVTDNLVRGLDYYNHTVFEVVSNQLGAQNALIAGGRYNDLIANMSNNKYNVNAFGFAAGVDRLALLLADDMLIAKKSIALLVADDKFYDYAINIMHKIHENTKFGINIIIAKDISAKLKKVQSEQYFVSIVIGANEYQHQTLLVKDAVSFEKYFVDNTEIEQFLLSKYNKYQYID